MTVVRLRRNKDPNSGCIVYTVWYSTVQYSAPYTVQRGRFDLVHLKNSLEAEISGAGSQAYDAICKY